MLAYIGLGSNLNQPIQQIRTAMTHLSQLPDTQLVQHSSLYRSAPMGPADQPDYINAVAALETTLSAETLLAALQQIEQQQGRVRRRHWGERTLDLDILLYGDESIATADLLIPHPGIASRAFVLYPLAEIAPTLSHPTLGTLTALLANCPENGLEKLDERDL